MCRFWKGNGIPLFLRSDPVVDVRHVSFTLYDELAVTLRKWTGLSFEHVLEGEQIVFRAAGIFGLYLIASSTGLGAGASLLVAAMAALGATIGGPSVLSFEYEPTPRAFAVPLVFLAVGCIAHGRHFAAAAAGSVALLLHAPTTYPFWGVYMVAALIIPENRSQKWRGLASLAFAVLALWLSSLLERGGAQTATFFARIDPAQETLQQMRASYNWVSTWWRQWVPHYALLCAVTAVAIVRLRRIIPASLLPYAIGLPLIGALSVPASYLLLEKMKLALLPQFQPMRALLFITVMAGLLAAIAACHAVRQSRYTRSLRVAGARLLDSGEHQSHRGSAIPSDRIGPGPCGAGNSGASARLTRPPLGGADRRAGSLLRDSDAGRRSQLSAATHSRPDRA